MVKTAAGRNQDQERLELALESARLGDYEWDMIKDIMSSAVERERVQGLYETFMQRLLSTAKVEVLNMDIVDRKNM